MSIIKPDPLHEQVERYVRSRIVSGVFAPGTRLPSTAALAKETGTSVVTVHRALARLARENILDRKPRHSTYVKGAAPALTCAGMYFDTPFYNPELGFFRALRLELTRGLLAQGVKNVVWSDDRPDGDRKELLQSLTRAIEKREIQALIAPMVSEADTAWLSTLPIPTAILACRCPLKTAFFTDLAQLARTGLGELQRQGCRSVGVISNLRLSPASSDSVALDFHRSVVESAGELGLETRNDWMRFPAVAPTSLSHYGYEQFHSLWNLDHHPDGLLVYPDTAASGVITAILERRLDVPRELKLVLHANDILPHPCPLPASILVTKVAEHSNELIRIINDQFAGREPRPVAPRASVIRFPLPMTGIDPPPPGT